MSYVRGMVYMKEKQKIQFNIMILPEWKEALERAARIKSFYCDKEISMSDLVREAIWNIISGSLKEHDD